MINLLPYNYRV